MKIRYIAESVELANRFVLKEIGAEEMKNLLYSGKFSILNSDTSISWQKFADEDEKSYIKLPPDFYYVHHYMIYLNDILIGVISFNTFYESFKDSWPEMLNLGKGYRTLNVCMLEILQDSKQHFKNIGPLELVQSVLDYLKIYVKEHNFLSIFCAAKNDRICSLFKRAGFQEFYKNMLIYFVE